MKLDIGRQDNDSDELQPLSSANWQCLQYKSPDDLFVTEEFVYQLVEEYECLSDKIGLLQTTVNFLFE